MAIEIDRNSGVATLLLEAAAGKPPTLDHTSLARLEAELDDAVVAAPTAMIVRAAQEKYFCVGANIEVLKEVNEQSMETWIQAGHRVLNKLEDLPFPTIARVSGYAMGGGLELAMACDMIFATDDSTLAQSEAKLGFVPGWGGSRRLAQRVGLARAKRMFFSGESIDGRTAAAWGLAESFADALAMDAEIERFVGQTQACSAGAVNEVKKLIRDSAFSSREANAVQELAASLRCIQNPSTQERLAKFLNRRK